ncbi:MAG TPA: hypothetical protein VHV28_14840 [Solirubrobacteraceae bacterium]|jgi:hypothetical protein|nr:hypothetical protein [Solirubrobacteraceae bacterium]
MSEFRVITDSVHDISGRLGGIGPEVSTFHGAASGHAQAGAGTPAAPALEGLMGRWSSVLPLYAMSADRLSAAIRGAAECYRAGDQALADVCGADTKGKR